MKIIKDIYLIWYSELSFRIPILKWHQFNQLRFQCHYIVYNYQIPKAYRNSILGIICKY
jgi:hypothetical protein